MHFPTPGARGGALFLIAFEHYWQDSDGMTGIPQDSDRIAAGAGRIEARDWWSQQDSDRIAVGAGMIQTR